MRELVIDPQEEEEKHEKPLEKDDMLEDKKPSSKETPFGEESEYEQMLQGCKDVLIHDNLHVNTIGLPKLVLTDAKKVDFFAFKACGMSLLTCSECRKICYGANLAFIGPLNTKDARSLVCKACFVKLPHKPHIVVFNPSYPNAKKFWHTEDLSIIFGYEKTVT